MHRSALLLLAVVGLLAAVAPAMGQSADRPNVILMMADDMGWGDVSYSQQISPTESYTGVFPTPNLEEMASAGMNFSRFYAASPLCSTTRASFMTGRQHERGDIPYPNAGHLRNEEVTMAEIAQAIGYMTGHYGKWHLGTLDREDYFFDATRGGYSRTESFGQYSTPWCSGYDSAFSNEKAVPTFNPYQYLRNEDRTKRARFFFNRGEAFPIGDLDGITLDEVDSQVQGDTSRLIIDQLIGTHDRDGEQGFDGLIQRSQAAEVPFFATIWFATSHGPLTHEGDNDVERYRNAITDMDEQVGRVRQFLAEHGLAESTLVLFCSDNGPTKKGYGSAGGLRGCKRTCWEGGIREPGLMVWPGEIEAGATSNTPAGVIDLLPTMLDIWGVSMPDDRPLDGESILPILNGATERQRPMMFDFVDQRIMISATGQYKVFDDALYDLWDDPSESNNLANQNPALAQEMISEWQAWKETVNASQDWNDYSYFVADTSGVRLLSEVELTAEVTDQEGIYLTDLRNGQRQAATPELFVERQYATLRQALAVDSSGTEGAHSVEESHTVAVDTTVHSFLLHFDPVQAGTVELSITFEEEILGVMGDAGHLTASDSLAFAPPRFEGHSIGANPGEALTRGGLEADDRWTIHADRRTITFHLTSDEGEYDQARIIIAAEM